MPPRATGRPRHPAKKEADRLPLSGPPLLSILTPISQPLSGRETDVCQNRRGFPAKVSSKNLFPWIFIFRPGSGPVSAAAPSTGAAGIRRDYACWYAPAPPARHCCETAPPPRCAQRGRPTGRPPTAAPRHGRPALVAPRRELSAARSVVPRDAASHNRTGSVRSGSGSRAHGAIVAPKNNRKARPSAPLHFRGRFSILPSVRVATNPVRPCGLNSKNSSPPLS